MKTFFLLFFILLLVVAALVALCVLPVLALVRRKPLKIPSFLSGLIQGNRVPDQYEKEAPEREKFFDSLPCETVELTAPDGARLFGRLLVPSHPNGILILACHGARSSGRGEFCFFAPDFFQKGYALLMPDHRGCGKSDGDHLGYGTHEKNDTFLWLDFVEKRFAQWNIYLLGVSMGAATVLMMSREERVRKEICGVIADCSYTSMWDEISYQMKASFHLPEFPLLPIWDLINRKWYGYSFRDASPIRDIAYAKCPVLLIHGGRDDFVPTYMQGLLYEACGSDKYSLTIPGAPHARSYYTDPIRYARAVEAFIRQTLPGKSARREKGDIHG